MGIGASAGGLEALFDNVSQPSGMAFVVVQLLSPDFKSLMDELLARHTGLPIHLVELRDGRQDLDTRRAARDRVGRGVRTEEILVRGAEHGLAALRRQCSRALDHHVLRRSVARLLAREGCAPGVSHVQL